jgi:hypothetical protein
LPIDFQTFVFAAIIPGLIVLVALLLDDWLRRRAIRQPIDGGAVLSEESPQTLPVLDYADNRPKSWAGGMLGAAIAAAFFVAVGLSTDRPQRAYPANGLDNLLVRLADPLVLLQVSVGLGVVAIFAGVLKPRWQLGVWVIVALGFVLLLSWPPMRRTNGWRGGDVALNLAVGLLPTMLSTPALAFVQRRRGALAPACAMAVTAAIGAAAIGFLGKSAMLSTAAIPPAAMAGAVVLFAAWRRDAALPISAWAVLALLTQASVLIALDPWSGRMPLLDGVPLLVAPLAALAALWGVAKRRWATACIAIVAVLACCGVTIAHSMDTAIRYREDGYL